jgi:hypothetical protein
MKSTSTDAVSIHAVLAASGFGGSAPKANGAWASSSTSNALFIGPPPLARNLNQKSGTDHVFALSLNGRASGFFATEGVGWQKIPALFTHVSHGGKGKNVVCP